MKRREGDIVVDWEIDDRPYKKTRSIFFPKIDAAEAAWLAADPYFAAVVDCNPCVDIVTDDDDSDLLPDSSITGVKMGRELYPVDALGYDRNPCAEIDVGLREIPHPKFTADQRRALMQECLNEWRSSPPIIIGAITYTDRGADAAFPDLVEPTLYPPMTESEQAAYAGMDVKTWRLLK